MLAVLMYIFSSFWIWLGFTMLLSIVVNGIVAVIHAIILKQDSRKRVNISMENKNEVDKEIDKFRDSINNMFTKK